MNHRTHRTPLALLLSLAAASLALAQPTTKPAAQPEKKPDTTHPAPKLTPDQPKDPAAPKDDKKPHDDKKPDDKKSSFKLTSPSIEHEKQMPKKHTVDGDPADATKKEISPALKWEGAPEGTKELALAMFDPVAGNFVHWVVYKIGPDVKELPEGLPGGKDNAELATPVKITQGKNQFGGIGYRGPAGRKGRVHRYHFRLYALDTTLDLKPGATRKELDEAMKGHILAECELVGTNER